MENHIEKYNLQELLSPNLKKDCSKFLEIIEYFDSITPTRESALIVKKAMSVQKEPIISFLLKKSFRLAAFKLKGASFKVSLDGLEKLLHSPDRLDDLALAITTVTKTEAILASDLFKAANWKEFPAEILPCFCFFYKNHGNSQDCQDLLDLTRNPSPIVIASAVEAIKKLDTGSLRSVIEPILKKNSNNAESEALEQLYATSVNYDSNALSNANQDYYNENHNLLIDCLKNGTSDLETVRILRLIRKFGDENDAEFVKPYLNTDNPDIVRASIKVLEKLSAEYLCVYLPQLMQHKNTKIKLTAIRSFQSIDQDSVLSMVKSLVKSLNINQRTLGITTSMMLDFDKIKEDLFVAFMKETNDEILEKIGLVIAANPSRNLVTELYPYHKQSKTFFINQRQKIIELVSEKVSGSLGGKPSSNELIAEAKKAYDEKKSKIEVEPPTHRYTNTSSNSNTYPKNIGNFRESLNKKIPSSNNNKVNNGVWKNLNLKAKLTVIFFILGSIFSSITLVLLIMELF